MLRRLRHFLAIAIAAILVALLAIVLLCYVNRWDQAVVITLIPIWAWAAIAMLISGIAWPALKSRFCLVMFAVWLVVGIALSDETAGLLRVFRAGIAGDSPRPISSERTGDRLRVITINCDSGILEAAESLKKRDPDIVFLQNAADRALLIDLTSDLFGPSGTFIRSESCAILANGQLGDSFTETDTGSLVATLERPRGEKISVANFNLPTAIPRFDLWESECWTDLTERRRGNRRTVRNLLGTLTDRSGNHPRLVGGSFGAPPSDDIYRLLRNAGMKDSFRQAGFGWGNTYSRRFRFMRNDQIWSTLPYLPERSETFTAGASRHLGVITEFRRAAPEGNLALATSARLSSDIGPLGEFLHFGKPGRDRDTQRPGHRQSQ